PRPRTCYRHRHLALRQTAAHVVPAPDGGGMASERRGRPADGRGLARPRPKSLTRRPKSAKIGGLIDTAMLVLEISQIPPEGLEVHEALDPASVHVEGEGDFALWPGGRLDGPVELVDGTSVHVRGRLSAPLRVECGRCLEPFSF